MQTIPIPPPSAPVRERLLSRLDEEPRWSLLRARSGFDKTLTVRGWLHAEPRRLASARWVQASPGDRIEANALQPLVSGRVRTLVLDLTAADSPVDTATLRAVGALARRLIVIANSTVVLPDHVAHLLDVHLIDADTLAYRIDELAAHVDTEDDPLAERVLDATGGWPALVRLAAARPLRTSLDLERTVADFVDELRAALTPVARSVIDTTCVTAEPTLALTVELSGLTDRDALQGWNELLAHGLASGSGADGAWRLLPIVRQTRLAQLASTDPSLTALHARAARWFRGRSRPIQAVEHAIAAADWDTAIEVLEHHVLELFGSDPTTARMLAHRIPAHVLAHRHIARSVRDILATTDGDVAEFTPAPTARTAAIPAASVDADRRDDDLAQRWRESIRRRHAGDFATALRFRERLHQQLTDPTTPTDRTVRQYLPLFNLQSGITAMLSGRFADAEQDLVAATHAGGGGFAAFARRNAFADLALLAGIEGDVPRGREHLMRMERAPRIVGFFARVARFGELVAESLLASARLDLDTARQALDTAARSADRDELWPFYLLARARLAVTDGSAAAALTELSSLRRTRDHLAGPDSAASFVVPLAEAELLLAVGETGRAAAVLDAAPAHPMLSGMHALQRLQSGQSAQAVELGGRALWAEEAGPIARTLACLARAVAELRLGHRERAAESFRFAHQLIHRFELGRTLGLVPRAALDELAALTGLPGAPDAVPELLPAPLDPVELTDREQVVLNELATGATLAGIARSLFVSENTVRTQVRAVYRKLGVHSRDEAIAEARRRGAID